MKTYQYFRIALLLLLLCLPYKGSLQNASGWECDIYQYQYDMTVYVALRQGSQEITQGELAAFVDGECRGVATLQYAGTQAYYYLRVRSNQEQGEVVSFKAYLDGEVKTLSGDCVFQSQQQWGFPSQPIVFELPLNPEEDDPFVDVNEETETVVVGEGELTVEKLNALNEKLTGESGEESVSQLKSLDLSQTTLPTSDKQAAQEAMEALLSNKPSLTFVELPQNMSEIWEEAISKEEVMKNSNPNALVCVSQGTPLTGENVVYKDEEGHYVASEIILAGEEAFQIPADVTVTGSIQLNVPAPAIAPDAAPTTYWGTVCLPFKPKGWSFIAPQERLRSETDPQIHFYTWVNSRFEEVEALEANTPYLYKMLSEGAIHFVGEENTVLSSNAQEYMVLGEEFDFVGTYTPVQSTVQVYALDMDEGAFISQAGAVPSFRAYMRPHATTTATKLPIEIANQPDEPENPDQPDTPDQPDEPENPDQPVIPDSIEDLEEGALLYAANGTIILAPHAPIEAWIVASTGHTIYHAEIADRTQVNVNTGIYMIMIKKGNEIIKEKLIVR